MWAAREQMSDVQTKEGASIKLDVSVPVADAAEASRAIAALIADGVAVGDFRMGQPSLDEVFFALTGAPGAPTNQEARP